MTDDVNVSVTLELLTLKRQILIKITLHTHNFHNI